MTYGRSMRRGNRLLARILVLGACATPGACGGSSSKAGAAGSGTGGTGEIGGSTSSTTGGASCNPSPSSCVPLGAACPGGSATCCQTGANLPVGAGCIGFTNTCVPRCNSSADCASGSCCIHNPSSVPPAGLPPGEPGGWCLTNADVAADSEQCVPGYGNNYICEGTYVCGYQCSPANGAAGAGSGGSAGGSSDSCDLSQGTRCAPMAVTPQLTSDSYSTEGTAVTFTQGAQAWTSYTYASAGQTAPTVVGGAGQLSISAEILASSEASSAFVGAGLYFASQSCADISAYRAITFTLTGNLGGCLLRVFVEQSADIHVTDDAVRGRCTDATCYGPSFDVAAGGDVTVPLSDLMPGSPCASLDPSSVLGVNWFFHLPDDATMSDSCATSVAISQIQLVE
jgi:hypothetical protein